MHTFFFLVKYFRLTLQIYFLTLFVLAEKIRVGKDYQAIVPPMQTKNDSFSQQEKALLVWAPAVNIPDSKVEEYVTLAKERYGYNTEQALGMLFWHKHDMEKAVIDLGNFTPFPEDWNKEDVVLFEQAFQFHGKCFHRIRQMVRSIKVVSDLFLTNFILPSTASRQVNCIAGKVLLLMEEDQKSNECDGSSGETQE
jgi:ELM2 domain